MAGGKTDGEGTLGAGVPVLDLTAKRVAAGMPMIQARARYRSGALNLLNQPDLQLP
jgi:hypothetical protein